MLGATRRHYRSSSSEADSIPVGATINACICRLFFDAAGEAVAIRLPCGVKARRCKPLKTLAKTIYGRVTATSERRATATANEIRLKARQSCGIKFSP
jgi:hypothetical protein